MSKSNQLAYSHRNQIVIFQKLQLSDLSENKEKIQTPLHSINGMKDYRFHGNVETVSENVLSLYVALHPTSEDLLSWPVTVKCEVSGINEMTDIEISLGSVLVTYQKHSFKNINTEIAKISRDAIQQFLFKNAFVLKWCITLLDHELLTETKNEANDPEKQFHEKLLQFAEKDHEYNSPETQKVLKSLQRDIKDCFTAHQNNEEHIDELKSELIQLREHTHQYLFCFNQTYSEITAELGSEADQITVKKEIIENEDAENELNKTEVETKIAHSEKLHYLPSSSLDNTYTDTEKTINLLLFGIPFSGKSATGNSILEQNVFRTGNCSDLISNKTLIQINHNLNKTICVLEYSEKEICRGILQGLGKMDRALSAVVVIFDYFTINSVNLNDKIKNILCPEYRTLYENYGILVVTGGDSFELDHGNSSFLDFYYNRIKTVQGFDCFSNRVVLFNNTTNSAGTKRTQHSELFKQVENLKKTGQPELTQNSFMDIFFKMFKIFLSHHKDVLITEWFNHPFFQMTDIDVFTFISSFKYHKNKQFQSVYNIITTINEVKGKTKFHYDLILFEDSEFVNKSLVEEFHSFSCLKIDVIGFAINLQDFCKLVKSRHDAVILVTSFSMLNSLDLHLALKDLTEFNEIKRKCILLITYDPEFDTDVADTDIEILCKSQGEDFKYLLSQCEHRAVLFDTTTIDVLTKMEQMLNLLKHIVQVTTDQTFEDIIHSSKQHKDEFNTTSEEMEAFESGESKHTDTDTETSHKKQRRKHRFSKFTKMKTSIDRDKLKKEKHEIDMEIKRLKKQHWEIKIAKLQKRQKVRKHEFNENELTSKKFTLP